MERRKVVAGITLAEIASFIVLFTLMVLYMCMFISISYYVQHVKQKQEIEKPVDEDSKQNDIPDQPSPIPDQPSTIPTQQSTIPTQQSTIPTQQSVITTQQSSISTQHSTISTIQSNIPTHHSNIPTQQTTLISNMQTTIRMMEKKTIGISLNRDSKAVLMEKRKPFTMRGVSIEVHIQCFIRLHLI